MWGATRAFVAVPCRIVISIHAPRVGRDWKAGLSYAGFFISIHAPRVGRDQIAIKSAFIAFISIHAPRVGRDCHKSFSPFRQCPISIHAPRVGRDGNAWTRQKRSAPDFNPRAPCGARPNRPRGRGRLYQFQSTRPVWGATASAVGCKPVTIISIHAPRVGRDGTVTTIYDLAADISIHAPRVGRDAGYTAILISA